MKKLPIIVGITGATGIIYSIKLLEVLKVLKIETILSVSQMGFYTAKEELNITPKDLIKMADHYYPIDSLAAPISSGSFLSGGMIVAPCSVKTLSAIANSYNDNLIARAADVCLKERRKLVLLFRETPLHLGHINLMRQVAESGGIIMPPLPAFYNKPKSIDDIVSHTVGRCLDLFHMDSNIIKRWE